MRLGVCTGRICSELRSQPRSQLCTDMRRRWPTPPKLPTLPVRTATPRLSPQRTVTKCQGAKSPVVMKTGIFPSGKRQPQLELPALILCITVQQMQDPSLLETVRVALQGGISAVLLRDVGGFSSAGVLYEAAVELQEILRERAGLWIEGRSDIAEAVNAKGVVLTDESVPLAVVRRMLKQKSLLLGKIAQNSEEAARVAADGVSFVMLSGEEWSISAVQNAKQAQRGGQVPVLSVLTTTEGQTEQSVQEYLSSGLDGICVGVELLEEVAAAMGCPAPDNPEQGVQSLREILQKNSPVAVAAPEREKPKKRLLLTEGRERMRQREKELLQQCLELLQRISPEIEERTLLAAALKQLDELFLVVVVGEYNSGKSSVVNALLGERFLDEGILPTTNEISVLRYAEEAPSVVVLPDGIVERTLPASLLQEINIVDTPGTNVVLERQQRLTEEYVPRADMVLFVLSCDRPFTESEVRFLEYIRKWGKKVIFVINKIDILSGDADVESVQSFVSQNAKRLLNLSEAFVWPVSARRALDAKLALGNSSFGGLYPTSSALLEADDRWQSSRFAEMETFVAEFFSGKGGAASAESVRLKLQTPLYVADALLDASRRQLKNERFAAEKDLAAAKAVDIQLTQFESDMRKDCRVQQQSIKKLIQKVVQRAEMFVDETLTVSNFFSLRDYLFESAVGSSPKEAPAVSKKFSVSVLGNAFTELQGLMEQQSSWIKKNCQNQLVNYRAFAENCAQQFNQTLEEVMASKETPPSTKPTPVPAHTHKRSGAELTDAQLLEAAAQKKAGMEAVAQKVVENQEMGLEICEKLVEVEIKEAVTATGGTALAAIGVGCILTLILPYTAEDVLALSISALIGYVALLNVPLRRGEMKGRIRKVAQDLEAELEKYLDRRLTGALTETTLSVQEMIQPLQHNFQNELERVVQNEEERSGVEAKLQALKNEILNIE